MRKLVKVVHVVWLIGLPVLWDIFTMFTKRLSMYDILIHECLQLEGHDGMTNIVRIATD